MTWPLNRRTAAIAASAFASLITRNSALFPGGSCSLTSFTKSPSTPRPSSAPTPAPAAAPRAIPAIGKTTNRSPPSSAPTTAPVSVVPLTSFFTSYSPSARCSTIAVSSREIWPSFSRPRIEASAPRASSGESKEIATTWLISPSCVDCESRYRRGGLDRCDGLLTGREVRPCPEDAAHDERKRCRQDAGRALQRNEDHPGIEAHPRGDT